MTTTTLPPSQLKRRWQHTDSDGRRQLIIDTALDLLQRHGLTEVTMRRVAARLGVGAMTLYTYIDSQAQLHRYLTRCGFEQLHRQCQAASTLDTPAQWRGGARAYLHFAIDHPNLYKLMFDVPLADTPQDQAIMRGGFEGLLEKVTQQMAKQGLTGRQLEQQAYAAAGRFWFALHGLASLLIAGRTTILIDNADQLLDDLLEHVSPT